MSSESSVASPSQSINPVLQAALGSLDIQLEEELARYQQQRLENAAAPPPDWEHQPATQTIEAISGSTTGSPIVGNESQDLSSPSGMLTLTTMVPGALNATNLGTNTPLGQNLPPVTNRTEIPSPSGEETMGQNPAIGVSALVPREPESAPPDDYLSSSEELLRSLAKEEAKNQKKTSFVDSLLTPWGLASILLLLLAAGAIAYLLQNPSLLTAGGSGDSGRSNAPAGTQNAGGTNAAANRAAAPPIPNAPNLATEEDFSELNLGNLGGLDTNSSQPPATERPALTRPVAPSANPRPASNGNPENLVQALLPAPQQPIVTSAPAPRSAPNQSNPAPAPSPTTKFSVSNARSTPNPNRKGREFYFVMADYAGDGSLLRAREIAPDALPVELPEGKKVQIATFFKESQAKASVARLRKQGIEARVYYSP